MTKPPDPPGVSKKKLEGKPPSRHEIYRKKDKAVLGYTRRVGEHGFEVQRYNTDNWIPVRANAPHTSAMWWLVSDPKFTVKDGFLVESLQEQNDFRSPDELPDINDETFPEGASKQITVNRYERDSKAREKCLAHWGYNCIVCNFSFEEGYGLLGKGYIHVHHPGIRQSRCYCA